MVTETIQKQRAIEQHSVQAGEFADRYRSLNAVERPTCFTYSRKRLEAYLDAYFPARGDGLKLLDVGCGTGHHMARLRERGFEVAGVDGSAEMLAHARDLNPGADVQLADVDRLPHPDASFDYVLCVEVLRYLPNTSGCVKEIARVLKPGGVALVTAAPRLSLNGYWLVNRLANAVPVGNLVRLKQFFTTSRGLNRAFRGAGFSEVTVRGVYAGPLNWVERLTPWALPTVLKLWEPIDAKVADAPVLRELSNMFLVHAIRGR